MFFRSSTARGTFRRRGLAAFLALIATVAVTIAGCGSSGTSGDASPGYRGDPLQPPTVLSPASAAATFRSTAGGTTTLGDLQKGRLLLLYFGYTHCPDVCPTTMADLGVALRKLPAATQNRTQVVFVTSDPARDDVPVMKAWLSNFDGGVAHPFVGLTASLKQIDAVATSVGVPLSPPSRDPNGTITVEHGAQTLAFVSGKAGLLWTAATSPDDYSHDISKLAATVPS